MVQMRCTSCNSNLTNDGGSTRFKCPNCGDEQICRCGRCRELGTKYICKCGFEGP